MRPGFDSITELSVDRADWVAAATLYCLAIAAYAAVVSMPDEGYAGLKEDALPRLAVIMHQAEGGL